MEMSSWTETMKDPTRRPQTALTRSSNAPSHSRLRLRNSSILFSAPDSHDGNEELIVLPAVSIKKSLRLSLQLLSMGGLQNEPQHNTWTVTQLDDPPGLSLTFSDNTAVVAVTFTDSSISFSRIGSTPSMAYRLQEAVIIGAFLKEIESLANGDGGNIAVENRLLSFDADGFKALDDAKQKYNIKNE